MTPSTLPQKLHRPLNEVKNFVEKMPDGVKLATVSSKVGTFASLSKKERDKIIQFLRERESVLVVQAKAVSGKNMTTFLRHKKFGYPKEIPGYEWPPVKKPDVKPVATATPPSNYHSVENKMQINNINTTSPESLRRQAEELLRAAEEAERKRQDSDFFNKKLAPVKLEICQAVGQMQRKMDEFIDCMDAVNKAAQKLKDLSL